MGFLKQSAATGKTVIHDVAKKEASLLYHQIIKFVEERRTWHTIIFSHKLWWGSTKIRITIKSDFGKARLKAC